MVDIVAAADILSGLTVWDRVIATLVAATPLTILMVNNYREDRKKRTGEKALPPISHGLTLPLPDNAPPDNQPGWGVQWLQAELAKKEQEIRDQDKIIESKERTIRQLTAQVGRLREFIIRKQMEPPE